MCVWGLCVCDLTVLFIVGESSSESVAPLQRLGCCRSLWREVEVVWQGKAKNPLDLLSVCGGVIVCVVPVEGGAGGHAPGKALDSQLSEVGDGGEVSSHDGHRVWRVHKEAVFSEDHVPVLTTDNI